MSLVYRGRESGMTMAFVLRTAQQRGVNTTEALTALLRALEPIMLEAFQPAPRLG